MGFGESFLAIVIGLGLSVACGFRAFIPMLVTSIAAHTGNLELAESLIWLGEWSALIALSVATVCEIILSKIGGIDNILDVLEAPLVFVAGTVLALPVFTDMNPLLLWGLAAIAGGGSAEVVHIGDAGVRGSLTLTTAGIGNIVFGIVEDVAAVTLSILSILYFPEYAASGMLPTPAILFAVFVLCLFLVFLLVAAFAIKKWITKRRRVPA